MSRRSEYDSYKDDNDYVSIDGKSWEYRDRNNQQMIDRQDRGDDQPLGYNRHSYAMTDPLYAYGKGAVSMAANQLGISNIDEKEEVDDILKYLNTPRASQEDFDDLEDRVDELPKDDEQTEEAVEPQPEEPIVLSDRAQSASEFVTGHSWTGDNSNGISPFASTKYAGLDDQTDTDLKDAYSLNLVGGLRGAGIPTRGPGAPGTPGGYGS